MERITSKYGNTLAIVIPHDHEDGSTVFFTPPDFSQQVGQFTHKQGHEVKPHIHKKVVREVTVTQEVLYIKKGRVHVSLYDEDKELRTFVDLRQGDIIVLVYGGHSLKVIEDSVILEVKQGPYAGDDDKEYIEIKGDN